MKTRNVITVALIITGITAAPAADAQQNNPRHPSYFWGKTHVETRAISDAGSAAIAITNPLHPSYFVAKAGQTAFVNTGAIIFYPYVDNHNPLHPSYLRNETPIAR